MPVSIPASETIQGDLVTISLLYLPSLRQLESKNPGMLPLKKYEQAEEDAVRDTIAATDQFLENATTVWAVSSSECELCHRPLPPPVHQGPSILIIASGSDVCWGLSRSLSPHCETGSADLGVHATEMYLKLTLRRHHDDKCINENKLAGSEEVR